MIEDWGKGTWGSTTVASLDAGERVPDGPRVLDYTTDAFHPPFTLGSPASFDDFSSRYNDSEPN